MAEMSLPTIKRRVFELLDDDTYPFTLSEVTGPHEGDFGSRMKFFLTVERDDGDPVTLVYWTPLTFSDHPKCKLMNLAKALCGADVVADWDGVDFAAMLGKRAKAVVKRAPRNDGNGECNIISDILAQRPAKTAKPPESARPYTELFPDAASE